MTTRVFELTRQQVAASVRSTLSREAFGRRPPRSSTPDGLSGRSGW
jgi:hypothetical protein